MKNDLLNDFGKKTKLINETIDYLNEKGKPETISIKQN
jgi:hypothetical protein